ncbi:MULTISPECIES: NUDIX hydrolase [unclassified Rhizobium]|uniref:NUDIX hydrolase n=1 Tax=unclassified Rhizobium TaxID=2613769 RepID=UPI002180CF84|nr:MULTISPECIES: DNA mismatch repair protein MutT [unclassified Rhizobium]
MKKVRIQLNRLADHTKTILEGGSAQQYGALCFRPIAGDGVEVRLITTRETRRWIPKGWPTEGLAPHEVAEREAWEEAGVKGRAKNRIFGHFGYTKSLADGQQVPAFLRFICLKRATPKAFSRVQKSYIRLDATRRGCVFRQGA